MPDGIKYLMKMSLFLLMNCDVFCSGFPDFPEAIPFLAKYIARTNQKCAKGTGNKSRSGADIKPLKNTNPLKYRLRVGEYRIIYVVKDDAVPVIDVFKRGKGYTRYSNMVILIIDLLKHSHCAFIHIPISHFHSGL